MSYRLGLNLRTTFLYFIGYDEIKDKETIFKTLHKYHHFYLLFRHNQFTSNYFYFSIKP